MNIAELPVADLLNYWFGETLGNPQQLEARARWWFVASSETDREIQQRFGQYLKPVAEIPVEAFAEPEESLAGVLVLDQFPRNLFRRQPQAFAFDDKALNLVDRALERGWQHQLHPVQVSFLYMPLQHAEDLERQIQGVALYRELLKSTPAAYRKFIESSLAFAEQHRDIIRRFGRFPHRNQTLGRTSTPEEQAYLAGNPSRFGQ